jgi:hypothetical protein
MGEGRRQPEPLGMVIRPAIIYPASVLPIHQRPRWRESLHGLEVSSFCGPRSSGDMPIYPRSFDTF